MAYSLDIYSPFVRPTQAGGEMSARAGFYGKKIRTDSRAESGLYWSYGKKVWARIGGGKVALGFAGGETNSNRLGDLSLYTPRRHLPKLPLLMGIDVSNEGAMGSLIKGNFNFTVYPEVTRSAMALGAIENAYFVPGKFCNVSFGWSTYAANKCASSFGFRGSIFNFNWSVNTDMSVSAQVSVITAATVAVGAPGGNTIGKTGTATTKTTPPAGTIPPPSAGSSGTFNPLDPKQIPVIGFDLASVIDEVMAELNPILGSGGSGGSSGGLFGQVIPPEANPEELYGVKAWQRGNDKKGPGGNREGLVFGFVGIPWQPEPPSTDEVTPNIGSAGSAGSSGSSGSGSSGIGALFGSSGSGGITKPIVKKYWYINFGSIERYLNKRLAKFQMNNGVPNTIDIDENRTKTYGWSKSAYPIDVLWNFSGYKSNFTENWDNGTQIMTSPLDKAPIGGLWFGVDHIKKTWREFFTDANSNLTQKSIIGFLTELGKRANEASGDNWQLGTTVIEDYNACGGPGETKSVISVEDFGYTEPVPIFKFEASGFRPMIKNVSISCKPPAPLATAAFVGGRTGDLDTPTGNTGTVGGDPTTTLADLDQAADDIGINNAWGDAYRSALKLAKKNEANHHALKDAIYPVDFSVTVDGISGFKFGDAVTTNLIPANYVGRMFFTVTKISHKVDALSWETTLNTAARMK